MRTSPSKKRDSLCHTCPTVQVKEKKAVFFFLHLKKIKCIFMERRSLKKAAQPGVQVLVGWC
jgi:hypothetical protein